MGLVDLPHHPASSHEAAALELHPIPGKGMIVKVEPPRKPSISGDHVPCDIVLVIDVSGSMTADAPVPTKPGEEVENNGLSVLDLTKHAARTIVETLNENDRLGIVTFASASTTLQGLLPMTAENKKITDDNIESMQPQDATNLWHGIRDGLRIFKDDTAAAEGNGPQRIPALMVLTDGCPNHMCPTQGYVPKLRSMGGLPATINTFGFGYNVRSGLLKSIAEIGGGNYSFIPDAGMVGTVFIHAVANLQSTFAQNAVLRLVYRADITPPTPQADQQPPSTTKSHILGKKYTDLTIPLHNLQYGQSRDIYLKYTTLNGSPIEATLTYQRLNRPKLEVLTSTLRPDDPPPLPEKTYTPEVAAYHISRHQLVSFLLGLTPPSSHDDERTPQIPLPEDTPSLLAILVSSIPANQRAYSSHPLNKSLMEDLRGQVTLALTRTDYYSRWGQHYLPSLAGAHASQICNSFKDPGPLMYGTESPLFQSCRDRLDKAFDELPAPKPSNAWGSSTFSNHGMWGRHGPVHVPQGYRYRRLSGQSFSTQGGGSGVMTPTTAVAGSDDGGEAGDGYPGLGQADPQHWRGFINMSSYNSRDNPCFAGCVKILLAEDASSLARNRDWMSVVQRPLTPAEEREDSPMGEEYPWLDDDDDDNNNTGETVGQGGRTIRIGRLRAGMRVATPKGPRRVVAVLKTAVQRQEMCLVGRKGLLVTPWHPVCLPSPSSPARGGETRSRWVFPRDISRRKVRYTGSIYSVLLERDPDEDAHAVMVGGMWGVTLGHGLTGTCPKPSSSSAAAAEMASTSSLAELLSPGTFPSASKKGNDDVRMHPFFGDYEAVARALSRLHRNSGGLVLGAGVKRDERTGLVDGFRRLSGVEVTRVVEEMIRTGSGARGRGCSRSSSRVSASSSKAGHDSRSGSVSGSEWRMAVGCV